VRSHKSSGWSGFAEFELSYHNQKTMFRPPWLDSGWLCGFAEALVTFRNPSQRFLRVLGISPKFLESSSRKSEHSSRVLRTSSSLLNFTRLGPTLWLRQSFSNLRKSFPKVPSGTGNFPTVLRVILKEVWAFSQFPLQSPNSFPCTI